MVISDYTFQKNRIFVYLNLSDDELMLFDKLYALLEPQIPVPDLVLYLVADVNTCMDRIRKRQRNLEKAISQDYIAELIDACTSCSAASMPRSSENVSVICDVADVETEVIVASDGT